MTTARKTISFASMMVRAQRRHEARMADRNPQPDSAQRELAMRRTLQKMSGTKRLLVFMYPA